MNKKLVLKASFLTATIALLTGCSTMGSKDFGCPAPQGIVCKSPTEIYEMTHGDTTSVYQNGAQNKQGGDDMFKSSTPTSSNGGFDGNLNKVASANPFSKPAYLPNSNPVPVLEQPKVVRVWVAPWVDENQTLNYPSYKFKEVTPRKWNFGGATVFRNALPTTAPDNSADFQSPSSEVPPNAQQAPQAGGQDVPAGVQRQHDMVNQNTLGTADFHNDQSPNGLPVEGSGR